MVKAVLVCLVLSQTTQHHLGKLLTRCRPRQSQRFPSNTQANVLLGNDIINSGTCVYA